MPGASSRKRKASPLPAPSTPKIAKDVLTTPVDHYELLEVVGEGTFSVVRKARRQSDPQTFVAVKRLRRLEQAAARIRDEVQCLRALRGCDNVAQLLDCHRADGDISIVMPYFEHHDFADHDDRNKCDKHDAHEHHSYVVYHDHAYRNDDNRIINHHVVHEHHSHVDIDYDNSD